METTSKQAASVPEKTEAPTPGGIERQRREQMEAIQLLRQRIAEHLAKAKQTYHPYS